MVTYGTRILIVIMVIYTRMVWKYHFYLMELGRYDFLPITYNPINTDTYFTISVEINENIETPGSYLHVYIYIFIYTYKSG